MPLNVTERKLTAIMIADIVGFSRIMERNEVRTFERLRALREEVTHLQVDSAGGRIITTTGDGFLAEFSVLFPQFRRELQFNENCFNASRIAKRMTVCGCE